MRCKVIKKEKWVITLRVNMIDVFSYEIDPVPPGTVTYVQVPPDLIYGGYEHLQIKVERKRGKE